MSNTNETNTSPLSTFADALARKLGGFALASGYFHIIQCNGAALSIRSERPGTVKIRLQNFRHRNRCIEPHRMLITTIQGKMEGGVDRLVKRIEKLMSPGGNWSAALESMNESLEALHESERERARTTALLRSGGAEFPARSADMDEPHFDLGNLRGRVAFSGNDVYLSGITCTPVQALAIAEILNAK